MQPKGSWDAFSKCHVPASNSGSWGLFKAGDAPALFPGVNLRVSRQIHPPSKSRPAIIIVPGASALPELYYLLINGMKTQGYEIEALHLPSVGLKSGPREGQPPSMYDDAAFIASRVAELSDAGNDVLLVTHSYGGTPATESIRGLSKKERERQGKKGGVVGIAYMTSLVPEVGMSAGSVQAVLPERDQLNKYAKVDDAGWIHHLNVPVMAASTFSTMPKEEGEAWAAKMVPHSAPSFGDPLTYPGFRDVEVSYLVCEKDLPVPPVLQRGGIDMIERVTGKKVDVTSIEADHAAPLSMPDAVIEWLAGVAQKF